jgi:threonyl-tRNA synthetase
MENNAGNVIKLTLPDGSVRECAYGASVVEVVKSIGAGLAKAALGAKLDNNVVGLNHKIEKNAALVVLTFDAPEGREILRHSTSHLMAHAVQELFPGTKIGIGPALDDGFYYDFGKESSFVPEDLERIEAKMQEIVKRDLPIVREELSRDQAVRLFESRGEVFKAELARDLPESEAITVFRQGDFVDLCRGPHVPSTGRIRAFKLTSLAGAYWRGNDKNPMMQRVYGTCFDKKEEMEAHFKRIEEAKKRDHRRIGKDLDLFSLHDDAGGGLVYWHPNGARMRTIIEDWWRGEHFQNGYDILYTPHIGRAQLWETSGHLQFYKEGMYSPMEIDDSKYYVKPMNCPFHIKIFQTNLHSYRDLPLRWAELGTVYRYEKSGVLHGLLRVRGFTQDDAHIICTPEQMQSEIQEVLRFSLHIWKTLGFTDIKAYLATKPPKSVGETNRWEQAQQALLEAIKAQGLSYEVDEGGGAFYGPKIDMKIKDAIGREWQMTTIQFDFNLPERFDLTYVGEDGQRHRPYMIHRALLGSIERFFGVLIEHYAGNFPLWFTPKQIAVININSDQEAYARTVAGKLRQAGFRIVEDYSSDRINAKIRNAEMQKIPYMAVIGPREADQGMVALRRHGKGDQGTLSVDQLLEKLRIEVETKATGV